MFCLVHKLTVYTDSGNKTPVFRNLIVSEGMFIDVNIQTTMQISNRNNNYYVFFIYKTVVYDTFHV